MMKAIVELGKADARVVQRFFEFAVNRRERRESTFALGVVGLVRDQEEQESGLLKRPQAPS